MNARTATEETVVASPQILLSLKIAKTSCKSIPCFLSSLFRTK
ncbi:unnamed protein product [Amoebophrya sp. A120]|nr:unnamed protein product [Amoebophrya sp. A120]|eukprot:GSA120T00001962001.1